MSFSIVDFNLFYQVSEVFMKLEYKILWIDNDDRIYEDHQEAIEGYLDDFGFSAVITKVANYDAFTSLAIILKDFDLFLLDYRLDGPRNGNEIIREIRDTHSIYTDVVFYSTVKDDLRNRIYEDNLNGVYFTGRAYEEFQEYVINVIDVTIKKTQDVNNLRGLIMAEVAELDRLKKVIIKKYVEKNIDHTVLKKYIKKSIFDNNCEDPIKKFPYLSADNDDYLLEMNISELIDSIIFDSFKKSRTVFKVKKLESGCSDIPFFHNDYFNDVIKKRNVFAHEEEKTNEYGVKYLSYSNGQPLYFTQESCIEIRRDIKKYKKYLEDIVLALEVKA